MKSLAGSTTPKRWSRVHVVADNCTDGTADVGRAAPTGVEVHEHDDPNDAGKGPALQWLLARLTAARDEAYDAVVFIDADTIVDPQFLRVRGRAILSRRRAP